MVSAAAAGATWQPTGPSGGRVTAALALPGAVLVGTGYTRGLGIVSGRGGTLFRSTDQGKTYSVVSRFTGHTVTSLLKVSDTRVYAGVTGTAQSGVYVSDDSGATFSPLNTGLPMPAHVRALSLAAGSPERVYALVDGTVAAPDSAVTSVYRLDGAGPWQVLPLTGVDPVPGGPLKGLAADVMDRERVYLADGARVYASANAGQAFAVAGEGAAVFGAVGVGNVTVLRTDPLHPQRLLLGTSDLGLFESLDQGVSFTHSTVSTGIADVLATSAGQTWVATADNGLLRAGADGLLTRVGSCLVDPSVTAVAPLPDLTGAVVAGTTGGAYVSTDDAASFVPANGLDELVGRVVASGDSLWLMSAVGLYRSTDGAGTWTRVAASAGSVAFSDVAVDPANPARALLATDEDLYEGHSPALSLMSLNLTDGTVTRFTGLSRNIAAVRFDPLTPGRVWAYQRRGVTEKASIATGLMVGSGEPLAFGPTPLTSSSLALKATYRFSPLAVGSDGTLFAGTVDGSNVPGLLRSTDSGATGPSVWTGAGWVVHGVQLGPGGEVYLAGKNSSVGIRKSADHGGTFVDWSAGLSAEGLQVYQLAFTGPSALVAATGGGVRYAADGTTFSALDDGLTAPTAAWSVAVSAGAAPVLVVTTDHGVFRRLAP